MHVYAINDNYAIREFELFLFFSITCIYTPCFVLLKSFEKSSLPMMVEFFLSKKFSIPINPFWALRDFMN
jgi:hypothetical protein